jgi:hypothetical protein
MRSSNTQISQSLRPLIRAVDFCNDLSLLQAIPEADFVRVVNAFRAFTGFLDFETAQTLFGDDVLAEPSGLIWNFARNLGVLREKLSCSSDELAQQFVIELRRQGADPRAPQFGDDALALLQSRLDSLAEPFGGIELQRKAVVLTEATGNRLLDFTAVCDMRPVFDDGRTRVAGLFPVTTLQLTFETMQGPEKVEMVLSPQQVETLAEVALTAKRKIDALVQLASRCGELGIGTPEVWET